MISIITCSITPARYEALCENLRALLGDEPHEFVGIHDAKSMAEGYNRGLAQARGDTIIACHDDIEILAPNFPQILQKRLEQYDLLGVAGSTSLRGSAWVNAGPPYIFGQIAQLDAKRKGYDVVVWSAPAACVGNMRIMDGVFLAGKRSVFESTPFDQKTFRGFHLYDLDFTLRASAAGFKLAVCTDLMLIHSSRGSWDQHWAADAQRFIDKHRQSFDTHPVYPWSAMRVRVEKKEDLFEILRSPYWHDKTA